ncbi:MAG: RHS repeat-associated core domain-containing protein, partial [Planctomycetes bacterium]|nr:RHS repeat-associated core domain-containing protein [Planctomycetota bacterium]
MTTCTYDERSRLIGEIRVGTNPYDLAYTYDAGGNRVKKLDANNDLLVQYQYDYTDPATYGSDNNRLMFYETFDTSGPQNVLLETTWYFYNPAGNPTRIVTSAAGTSDYSATLFSYASNGSAVSFVLGETWTDTGACEEQNYVVTYAREFRYDAARARYLNRELDPDLISADPLEYMTISATWSDYDGDTIYGDFAVDEQTGALTEERSFEPGLATVDPWAGSGGASTKHFTTNHLGTTRGLTNSSGTAIDSATYTAFGERIDGTNHRYGYAGAWGYQAHDDFPYVHVGARYYDPATGRFLQRDPIGISGGWNVYAYVQNAPTGGIDPRGLVPPMAGEGIKGGIEAYEGMKICAAGAQASRNDWRRQ